MISHISRDDYGAVGRQIEKRAEYRYKRDAEGDAGFVGLGI